MATSSNRRIHPIHPRGALPLAYLSAYYTGRTSHSWRADELWAQNPDACRYPARLIRATATAWRNHPSGLTAPGTSDQV